MFGGRNGRFGADNGPKGLCFDTNALFCTRNRTSSARAQACAEMVNKNTKYKVQPRAHMTLTQKYSDLTPSNIEIETPCCERFGL